VLPDRMPHLPGRVAGRDELRAVRRNEKLAASILQQLREGPTPSICAVDSEEWHRDDGYDPADNDDLPELCPDSEDDDDEEDDLEEGDGILYTVFAPSRRFALAAPSRSTLRRPTPGTLRPPELMFRPGLQTSRTSSTRSPLTPCQRSEHGTTPLNSSQMRSQPTARSTRSPRSNRRSSMPSLWRG
jgi:hypothetical protein